MIPGEFDSDLIGLEDGWGEEEEEEEIVEVSPLWQPISFEIGDLLRCWKPMSPDLLQKCWEKEMKTSWN